MSEMINKLNDILNIKNDMKDAIINKGQSVANFASYPNSIINITGGKPVFQYGSIEEMRADEPNRKEGDIGILYKQYKDNPKLGKGFSNCFFPNKVVFNSTPTYTTSSTVISNVLWMISFTNSSFGLNSNSSSITNIRYSSNDGLTYTSDQEYGYQNLGWFGVSSSRLADILKFFLIDKLFFNCVYQFNSSYNSINTQLLAVNTDVYKTSFYGINGIEAGSINNICTTILDMKNKVNIFSTLHDEQINTDNLSYVYSNISTNYFPNIDTSGVTDMSGMFYNCQNLTSLPNINTSSCTNMDTMFQRCINLTSISELDTTNVESMSNMFRYCNNLQYVNGFDTSNCKNLNNTFYQCHNLLEVPNINTSNCTSLSGTFVSCSLLSNIPNLDTSNVTDMSYLFSWCNNISSLPNFDTSKVTNMSYIFANSNNIPFPNWDMNNVTNLSSAFYGDNAIGNIANLYLPNVESFYMTFMMVHSMKSAKNIYAPNIKDFGSAFFACVNLVDFDEINAPNITNMVTAFRFCNNLSNASIQNIINMILNSKINNTTCMNLNPSNYYGPFNATNITSSRYSNRLSELTAAGWKY